MQKTSTYNHAPDHPSRIAVVEGDADRQVLTFPQRTGQHSNNATDARQEVEWLAQIEASRRAHQWRVRSYPLMKRWFDFIVAGLAIVVFSPIFALAALAVWCESREPIIFRQARVGKDGTRFTMYKFRTMVPDRRTTPASYRGPERRVMHKTRTDPRVTYVGRVLRRTSIDELPQLFNVLRGEMSLVGPRPELPRIVERYTSWQHLRHRVKPGMTGWWQVQGRSDRPMHEHTELDVHYVVHQSFTLDMTILLRTFRAVLQRSGAF